MRFLLLALLLVSETSAFAQSKPADNDTPTVDVELVLAVDVSFSMDKDELALLREGYAQAIVSKDFIQALKNDPNRKLTVTYFEWSSSNDQKIIVPWRVIDGHDAAAAVAAEIMKAPAVPKSRTSISGAINFAMSLFDNNPNRGSRRVINISGNGPNNSGEPVLEARNAALAKGITIDGLPIMKEPTGPQDIEHLNYYYEDCVTGGPGSSVMKIEGRDNLQEVIGAMLVREVAGFAPERSNISSTEQEKRISCSIGEEMFERIWKQPSGGIPVNVPAKPQRGRSPQMLFNFPHEPDAEVITAAMTAHFRKCWTASQTGPTIQVMLNYKPDGTYASPPLVINPEDTTEYSRTAARVMRQLNKCPPLKIPKDKYDQVRALRWQFPSDESAKASKSKKT
jgi:hypothetical protein